MKSISVYQRKKFLYFCAPVYTEQGVGMLTGPCIKLPVSSSTTSDLGEAALESLAQSGAIAPHPTDTDALPPSPVLAAAGVKSWSTFSRGATCLGLTLLDSELRLVPTRREQGMNFMPLDDDQELHLPLNPAAAQLGEAIQQGLARCR